MSEAPRSGESRVAAARFVADHWRKSLLESKEQAWAAHPLCMVLAALDGETDPIECGIDPWAHDAFRAALSGASSASSDPTGAPYLAQGEQ